MWSFDHAELVAARDEAARDIEEFEGAIAPVYSIEDIVRDPQYLARETITRVTHPKLGSILMQNVIPKLDETPGRIEHPGAELGEHNGEVYEEELDLSAAELADLRAAGVV